MVKDKDELVNIDGKLFKKEVFIIEDNHPIIGRILIVENVKFKILDEEDDSHKSGTYMARLNKEDERRMKEYDNALDTLSKKLVDKPDLKRLIKENMKYKSI